MGFVNRVFFRIMGLLGVFLAAGLTTNWQHLMNYSQVGLKTAILNTIQAGVTAAFAGIPAGVKILFAGDGGGMFVGMLLLILPWMAFFIIVDFILDIATGLETDAPHIISAIIAFGLVVVAGLFNIGFSDIGRLMSGELANQTTNVTNATNATNLTIPNTDGNMVDLS